MRRGRQPARGGCKKRSYFESRRAESEDDDREDDPNAARASRRRRLEALRVEVEEETDPQVADAWQRMLKEREELARSAEAGPKSDGPEAEEEEEADDAESMEISGDEAEEEEAPAPPITAEQEVMTQLLGFTSFGSTKGEAHGDAEVSGVRKKSRRQYRQYMNRKGGFNRPLSPVF